jgi:hypothetical protein
MSFSRLVGGGLIEIFDFIVVFTFEFHLSRQRADVQWVTSVAGLCRLKSGYWLRVALPQTDA